MKFKELVDKEVFGKMINEVKDYLVSIIDEKIIKIEADMKEENKLYSYYAEKFKELWDLKIKIKTTPTSDFFNFNITNFLYDQNLDLKKDFQRPIDEHAEHLNEIKKIIKYYNGFSYGAIGDLYKTLSQYKEKKQ